MRNQKFLVALALSAGLFDTALGQANGRLWTRQGLSARDNNDNNNNNGGGNGGGNNGGGNNQATCLNPDVIQKGSADDGQSQGDAGVKAGQAKSAT